MLNDGVKLTGVSSEIALTTNGVSAIPNAISCSDSSFKWPVIPITLTVKSFSTFSLVITAVEVNELLFCVTLPIGNCR